MRISGLSNQWQTRDGLFASFVDPNGTSEKARMMHELLLRLELCEGPDIWAGTSHNQVNLVYRDCPGSADRVPPFATMEVVRAGKPLALGYRIGFRVVEGKRPTDQWTTIDTVKLDEAVALVMDAVAYSTVHQRSDRS